MLSRPILFFFNGPVAKGSIVKNFAAFATKKVYRVLKFGDLILIKFGFS